MRNVVAHAARARFWGIACAVASALIAVAGLLALDNYAHTPGTSASGELRTWPPESRLQRHIGEKTLLVFIHPYCPCSRASLEQLQRILARSKKLPAVHVVFPNIQNFAASNRTNLWELAKTIPGVHLEKSDTEVTLFEAQTSGQAFLFDEEGALIFSGGITPARGHAGDSTGSGAILSALNENKTPHTHASVFGCALLASIERSR